MFRMNCALRRSWCVNSWWLVKLVEEQQLDSIEQNLALRDTNIWFVPKACWLKGVSPWLSKRVHTAARLDSCTILSVIGLGIRVLFAIGLAVRNPSTSSLSLTRILSTSRIGTRVSSTVWLKICIPSANWLEIRVPYAIRLVIRVCPAISIERHTCFFPNNSSRINLSYVYCTHYTRWYRTDKP